MIVENGGFKFDCNSRTEQKRAATLFTKEAGTIEWLKSHAKPGSVFYDIGANVGVYTVVAGVLGSKVYAFEPHKVNAESLRKNIALNGIDATVMQIALGGHDGTVMFNYRTLEAGSSGSQAGHTNSEDGIPFDPCLSEEVQIRRLDGLKIEKPDFIKLDVDGNELDILFDMGTVLRRGVSSVQVEIHPRDDAAICGYMASCGYALDHRHYTASGKAKLASGAKTVTHNAVFRWIG